MATTRRPQDRKPASNVTALPEKVHYSLLVDNEEPAEPFRLELDEDTIVELTDPTELPVEELAAMREPLAFLRSTAPDQETLDVLRKLSAKKFGKVMRAYFEHFGIDDAPGKSNGLGF
jgi:hypothetical protein